NDTRPLSVRYQYFLPFDVQRLHDWNGIRFGATLHRQCHLLSATLGSLQASIPVQQQPTHHIGLTTALLRSQLLALAEKIATQLILGFDNHNLNCDTANHTCKYITTPTDPTMAS